MLVRREALERGGEIDVIRHEIIDDCALGRAMKAQGPIWLGLTDRAVSVRPYEGMGEIRRMVARSAYAQLSYSPLLLAGTVIGMALVYAAAPSRRCSRTGPGPGRRHRHLGTDGARLRANAALLSPQPLLGLGASLDRCFVRRLHPRFAVQHWRGRGGCGRAARRRWTGHDRRRSQFRQGPSRREFSRRVVARPAAAPPADPGVLPLRARRRRRCRPCDRVPRREAAPARRDGAHAARRARQRAGSLHASEGPAGIPPERAACAAPARSLPPRRHQAALCGLGRADGLLPLFGDAGRPLRAGRARRGSCHMARLRRALRRAAGDQPSAGLREGLPRAEPRLYPPGRAWRCRGAGRAEGIPAIAASNFGIGRAHARASRPIQTFRRTDQGPPPRARGQHDPDLRRGPRQEAHCAAIPCRSACITASWN